ncbi:MAG: cupin domain-containing protein [Candidatus Eremiobacteraeota bacterium]|nr:cupin domain-containing protein [Candidatus Eremiobacteraeota bacterium]
MFYPLRIPNTYGYSRLRTGEALVQNVYFIVTGAGNILIDPLPIDDAADEQITQLGGVSKVVVMTAERTAGAKAIAARYGAAYVGDAAHCEEVAPGLIAIALPNQRRSAEFALCDTAQRCVFAGEVLLGAPAGALSMSDEGARASAALGLRRILRQNPDLLLVSRGQSIFSGAYDALYRLLYATAGAAIHRINLDELDYRDERDERTDQPSQYAIIDAEVGFEIGARGLGYRVSILPPGNRFCPLHGHAREEELFYVIEGEPSVRMSSGTIQCRKGDFIALPVGESGTHQLVNESDAPATVLLLARSEEFDACYYPDSDKLLVDVKTPLDGRASILVAAHPQLDYFDGEK